MGPGLLKKGDRVEVARAEVPSMDDIHYFEDGHKGTVAFDQEAGDTHVYIDGDAPQAFRQSVRAHLVLALA